MWTRETCGRMAGLSRETECYPSDLTDEELFRTIHDAALMPDREAAGREASPTSSWTRTGGCRW